MPGREATITYGYKNQQGLWLGEIEQQFPVFLAPGTGFVEDNFSMHWGRGAEGRAQSVILAKLCLLTSCCVAQFLTGHPRVPVHVQGVGTPAKMDP